MEFDDKHIIKSSVCIILDEKLNFLLLKRKDTDRSFPSIYCLPGGKIENDETPEECVVREVFEETNIHIEDYYFLKTIARINFYVTHIENCNVIISDEHESYIFTNNIEDIELGSITRWVLNEIKLTLGLL